MIYTSGEGCSGHPSFSGYLRRKYGVGSRKTRRLFSLFSVKIRPWDSIRRAIVVSANCKLDNQRPVAATRIGRHDWLLVARLSLLMLQNPFR